MKHQEKKYRVESFEGIEKALTDLGARSGETSTSTHYYAQHAGPGVTKLVIHGDGAAVHVLDEANGKFTLRENIPVDSKAAGLKWLQDKGFDEVSEVDMTHTDYEYLGGLVGLYTINEWLRSVILDYSDGQHDAIANELGLGSAEVITLPYNKYIEEQRRSDTMDLAQLIYDIYQDKKES